MKTYHIFSLLALLMIASTAWGAISPDNIKKMRNKCGELLQVKITKVEEGKSTTKDLSTQTDIVYRATVMKVERSKAGLKVGDEISIHSYVMSGRPLIGPRAPERLKPDWQGYVYANRTDDGNLKIGVFGHSFTEKLPE